MRLKKVFCCPYSANVLCRWKTKRMQEKRKKRQFLLRMNSSVLISCGLFRTICEHRLLLFRGNASNLISNGNSFDEATKNQLYTDIYDDSMWLINLVENLLSVTRIEEGRLNLHISEDLVDDVITEALHHVNRKSVKHHITVRYKEDYLLAKMDAKLMVQVIINIVDNAIKYTPKGSNILIKT